MENKLGSLDEKLQKSELTTEDYDAKKAELVKERDELRAKIELLHQTVHIIPPHIYKEVMELPLTDEERSLILNEISLLSPETARKLLKEYKKFLDST